MKLFIAGLLSFAAWSASSAFAQQTEGSEPLVGFRFQQQGIQFVVGTGGCTEKEDFNLQVEEGMPYLLHLVRTNADTCRGFFPEGKEIFYTYDEILGDGFAPMSGNLKFGILNAFMPTVVPLDQSEL